MAHHRDVWVLSAMRDQPVTSACGAGASRRRASQRPPRDLPSRVADNLFWLGRYAERADWTMRVLRSALGADRGGQRPAQASDAARAALAMLLTDADAQPSTGAGDADRRRYRAPVRAARCAVGGRYGLPQHARQLHRRRQPARDRLSLEAGRRSTASARPTVADGVACGGTGDVLDLLDEGLARSSAFNGLMHENMTRNYGWSFLDMGRRLERAYNLGEAAPGAVHASAGRRGRAGSLLLLLELADSFITYRSRYRLAPMLALVLDLLLLDETNPRTLGFQLAALDAHLDTLAASAARCAACRGSALILALLTSMRLADVERNRRSEADRADARAAAAASNSTSCRSCRTSSARRYFNLTEKDALHRVLTRSEPRP